MKIRDRLWNWGHLEGSHNKDTGLDCHMTPEAFATEYGIPNAFIVSYGGNIEPPFAPFARRFAALGEVKWSILGDASTPLPDDELGNTEDVIAALSAGGNITGGVVDDFFSPERMERFPPSVLQKIRDRLHEEGLDFWCVLYNHQLDMDLSAYLDCFDGITFWIWGSQFLPRAEEYLNRLFAMAGDKPVMAGVYLWDWFAPSPPPMDGARLEEQLRLYFPLLETGRLRGLVVCSSTTGDAENEANLVLKEWVAKYGDREIRSPARKENLP